VKFLIVAVGHRMPPWISAGFEEYARRMPRETRLALLEVRPEARHPNASAAAVRRVLEAEHRRIGALLPAGCCKVVLDERGRSFSTRELAGRIARWRGNGRDVAFIIGGSDGTAAELREEAELVWSLSPLTLPHGLARVVLAEQLYRATSILRGHPYHRE
jgi:23S rRNA (pseudouridine1915-N3)-methyltransferase